jgi:CRISPR-associated endonuclease/helicase Cas3
MEKPSASSELLSHPDKKLSQHLIETAELVKIFLDDLKSTNFPSYFPQLALVSALAHDMGKATSFFQSYLRESDDKKKQILKNKPETHHSLLSAIIAFYLAERLSDDILSPFYSYLVVKHHHSDLNDIRDDLLSSEIEEQLIILNNQVKSIDESIFQSLYAEIRCKYPFLPDFTLKDFSQWLPNFPSVIGQLRRRLRKEKLGLDGYLLLNFLYSLLIDADKSEVVLREKGYFFRQNLPYDAVETYKKRQKWEPLEINLLRESAYGEAVRKDIDLNRRIYLLNLPTGMGKTLISLAVALRLREKMEKERSIKPRIIYCAPFLSIIEQNFVVIRDVLGKDESTILLKHHHLSDLFYKTREEIAEEEKARILIEGWNSEVIITTFVQLFHTLISNRNSSLRKFHRLANSIIILDEVQSIPHSYWKLVREVLLYLAEKFNAYILLSTATAPLIFERRETFPLVNSEQYFPKLNRIVLIPNIKEKKTLNEFVNGLSLKKENKYLFIFNTISCAREFCELLMKKMKGKELTFLSTHITPKQREERIMGIREGKYRIVVSTQLVEAGVDIDFDVVYRDFAPLDCLIQSAGRCNRNGRKKGVVFVVKLMREDNKRTYASYIYDSVLLDATERILRDKEIIEESQFLNLIEEYYKMTREILSSDKAKELLSALMEGKYCGSDEGPYICDFKLIEEEMPKVDVFVEIDREAQEIWQRYCEIRELEDRWERMREFEKIKAKFYSYLISVPANSQNIPPQVEGFYYINYADLSRYYDPLYGFKCESELAIW